MVGKLLSYFKRLESLTNNEFIDLEVQLNELLHDEEKSAKLSELITEGKRSLNSNDRYILDSSVQRASTSIFIYNPKTKKEERFSLLLIPVSPIWNSVPKKVDEFFDRYVDVESILKKAKMLPKGSTATILPNWICQYQLEKSSFKEISAYLKQILESQDLMSSRLPTPFHYNEGEMIYIPLIITESLYEAGFIEAWEDASQDAVAGVSDLISEALSDDTLVLVANRISEFHESLSIGKSFMMMDEIMYYLDEVRNLRIPVKFCYLIKEVNKITFSATDDHNNELGNISIESNSERVLFEILDNTRFTLIEENQVKELEDKENIIKFSYIGHLS